MTFRKAERADIPALALTDIPPLARIRAAEWGSEEYWINRITGYLDGTHNPQKALEPRVIFVALEDSVPIGFIAGHLTTRFGCDAELEWINIVAERRGSEAAYELFRLLKDWFVEKNALRVCVNCDKENKRAYDFYTRQGARPLNDHWLVWDHIL